MKRFLFLLITVSGLLYGVACTRIILPGNKTPGSQAAPAVTVTPQIAIFPTTTPAAQFTATPIPQLQPIVNTNPNLEAFIRVPSGIIPRPYVIISGFESTPSNVGGVSLSGTVQNKSFLCPASPCAVEFPESAVITFQANNKKGDSSLTVQADIQVTQEAGGYSLSIITLGKYTVFTDACAKIWQNSDPVQPAWASFPQDPTQLNTEKSLHYLAAHLLITGIVNAKDCPGSGFDNYAPNACGLDRVKEQMVSWQNKNDQIIWLASRDQHIPPLILKTLLEIESQFWPTSQRLYLDEFGLGQVNQLGVDVVLRSNPDLYKKVCNAALSNCDIPYDRHSNIERAMIRGTLVQSLDAACPTCMYGVDFEKASQSIPLIAQVLYANCVQEKSIMDYYGVTANYEDSWKFTLVSFHSGFGCLQSAVESSAFPGMRLDWKTVSANLTCSGAVNYVNKFFDSMQGFNNQIIKPSDLAYIKLQNATPVPTPLPLYSNSRIIVKIFYDQNDDGFQQANEALNNVQVNLDLENGVSATQITSNGEAVFDLGSTSVGVKGTISLPGLYRSASITVPVSGDVPIIFIFARPVLSTPLP